MTARRIAEPLLAQSGNGVHQAASSPGVTPGDVVSDHRDSRSELPTGTVTFVLADVEQSVRLWQAHHAAMTAATAKFDALVSELVDAHHGARPVEQGEGDSFVAAFGIANDAVAFVVALQCALHTASWMASLPVRVRVGVHTGGAQLRDSDNYMGPTVNRCARIRALAHGGQVLLSRATRELVADALPAGVTLRDLGLHPLRDFDRPEHLFQLVHPDLPEEFPPLREPDIPARLPAVLTTFVARNDEMAAVTDLLAQGRLVTLTGSGGSGKTRLALEWAHSHIGEFPEGVAWADAAPVADGALVTSCVAGALGVREVPTESLIETIVREVGTRHVLLVLDNCEHVIDDVAHAAQRLLAECSGICILATSREPIGVPGETAMRVPSLDEDAAATLFADRARAVRPDFTVAAESAEAVKDVCRRLDGIPLAVELAAARVTVLTPQQIADGLADRFRLLTGGARTALPRQRTLEASVDWSYRLLSDGERRLLHRLSVFAGGFTLEVAQQVCADDELARSSILDLLSGLVDKSLVQVDADGSAGPRRYRMLETIRHFARERLADSPHAPAVRDRHLAYFVALAEEAGPRIEQGDELVWLDRLDADLDNVRGALDWAEQSGAAGLFLRLVAATWLFWEVRCRFEEGTRWLRRALAAAPEPTTARATALYGLGDISMFSPDLEQVLASGHEVVAIGEHLGDPTVIARGTTLLGWAACFDAYRDTSWAVDALGSVLDEIPEHEEPWLMCDARIARGVAYVTGGELGPAAAEFDKAIAGATRSRSVGSVQRAVLFRGWCHTLAGEVDQGEPLLLRAAALGEELDDTFFAALASAVVGYGRFLRGDLIGAEAIADEAVSIGDRYRNYYAVAAGRCIVAFIQSARGDIDAAWKALEHAFPIAAEMSFAWLTAWTEGSAALVEAIRGQVEPARGRLDAAARAIGARPCHGGSIALYRAWIERIAGDDAAAEAASMDAAGALAGGGSRALAAAALDELAISAARRGQFERAARLFGAADAERERLGVTRLTWPGVPARNPELAAARDALGDDRFAAETAAGAGLTLDAAVSLGLRGKGGRRRPASGWDSLTPAELEVVRLVSEGLTNPAIADKLLVTKGTVKVHLSHIFTRLGITSRAELAAEAARRLSAD